MELDRSSGDLIAEGSVKGSDATEGNSETATGGPAHFIADRMLLRRAQGTATLYGTGGPARLWSGGSQVEAPLIDMDRESGTVHAHGAEGALRAVRAFLPGAPPVQSSAKPGGLTGPVRIVSGDAVYTSGTRGAGSTAVFRGAVQVSGGASTLTADQATALFAAKSGTSTAFGGGSLQQVIAESNVRLRELGRTAAGNRLVYTVADARYELTGTPAAMPVVNDAAQGTITGTSLTFHANDESVQVSGGPGMPVHSDVVLPERASPAATITRGGAKATSRKPQRGGKP